jgi:hypothetical protein
VFGFGSPLFGLAQTRPQLAPALIFLWLRPDRPVKVIETLSATR